MRVVHFSLLVILAPLAATAQDTVVVRAEQVPAWGTSPALVEELRIGTLDGPAETSFGRVTAVVPVDSIVFIADDQAPAIRRFDAQGNYLGDAGRSGAGPGEFYSLMGLKRHPDGVALWDPRNSRITVYSPTGELLRSVRYASGYFTSEPFQVDTAGNFYIKARAPDAVPQRGRPSKEVWIRLSPDGSLADTIPIPLPSRLPGFVWYTETGPRIPFLIQRLSAMSPLGYMISGTNAEYALYRPLADGRVLRIERGYRPVPITRQERMEWEAVLELLATLSGTFDVPRIPGFTKPAFREIGVDQSGRIWVSRYVEAEFTEQEPSADGRPVLHWREPPVWDVLDPRGQFLGTVATPGGRWAAAVGERVWVLERGRFDESYVVRYRIVPGDSR